MPRDCLLPGRRRHHITFNGGRGGRAGGQARNHSSSMTESQSTSEREPNGGIEIRRLTAYDRAAFDAFWLALDPASRRSRFYTFRSDQSVAAYGSGAWLHDVLILGAFVGGRLCGVAELCATSDPAVAEAAFVVAPDQRRRGLGKALLEQVVSSAAGQGFTAIRVECPVTNRAMRRLAQTLSPALSVTTDAEGGLILCPVPELTPLAA